MVGGMSARVPTSLRTGVGKSSVTSVVAMAMAVSLSACGGSADGDDEETGAGVGEVEQVEQVEEPTDVEQDGDEATELEDETELATEPDDELEQSATGESEDDEPEETESQGDDSESEENEESEDDDPENDESEGDSDGEGGVETAAPTSTWLRTAERGDGGEHVEVLQARLNELGLAAGNPDGDYGRKTERAIKGFQRLIRVEPTGRADRVTLNYLDDFVYEGPVVTPDSSSTEVTELQERLASGPFDPGKPDGEYGTATTQAVWALEKIADIPLDGVWGPLDEWAWEELNAGRIGRPVKSNEQRWVEVDLSQQLMKVYEPGDPTPVLVSHVSSGSGVPWENEDHSGSSVTPKGDFHIQRRISGWRESSLNIGRLYNPLYFVGGIAFHGALSVPTYPASHGCVRVPMHIADYLPAELPNGTPVHVMA